MFPLVISVINMEIYRQPRMILLVSSSSDQTGTMSERMEHLLFFPVPIVTSKAAKATDSAVAILRMSRAQSFVPFTTPIRVVIHAMHL